MLSNTHLIDKELIKMTKFKKIALATACIALVATGGAYSFAKSTISDYRLAIKQAPLIEVAGETEADLNNGNIIFKTPVMDTDGFAWELVTITNLRDLSFSSVQSVSRLFATEEATIGQYAQFLDARTGALQALAITELSKSTIHAELSTHPIILVHDEATFSIPETQTIIDIDRANPANREAVFIVTGDMSINLNGADTVFSKPRALLVGGDSNELGFKVDGISVGDVQLASNIDASYAQSSKGDLYSSNVQITAEQLAQMHSFSGSISLNNYGIETALDLVELAIDNAMQTNTFNTAQKLKTLFAFARNGGEIELSTSATNLNEQPVEINARLTFDEHMRHSIVDDNAFSITDAAILKAELNVPLETAAEYVNPMWLHQFITDRFLTLEGSQVKTTIEINKMDSVINGVAVDL